MNFLKFLCLTLYLYASERYFLDPVQGQETTALITQSMISEVIEKRSSTTHISNVSNKDDFVPTDELECKISQPSVEYDQSHQCKICPSDNNNNQHDEMIDPGSYFMRLSQDQLIYSRLLNKMARIRSGENSSMRVENVKMNNYQNLTSSSEFQRKQHGSTSVTSLERDYIQPNRQSYIQSDQQNYIQPNQPENIQSIQPDNIQPILQNYMQSNQQNYVQSNQQNYIEPNRPTFSQANQPNYSQPIQQLFSQPDQPNFSQSIQQEFSQPNHPNFVQSNQPNFNQPIQPNYSQPNQQRYSQPIQPDNIQPILQNYMQSNQQNYVQLNQQNYIEHNQPTFSQANQPNYSQPIQQLFSQPDQPNFSQPNHPNFVQPNQPNFNQPIQQLFSQPDQPNLCQLNQLYLSQTNQQNYIQTNQQNCIQSNQQNCIQSNQLDFSQPDQQDCFQYNQPLANQNLLNQVTAESIIDSPYVSSQGQSNPSLQTMDYNQSTQMHIDHDLKIETFLENYFQIDERIKLIFISNNKEIQALIEEFEILYPCDHELSYLEIGKKNNHDKLIKLLSFYKEIYFLFLRFKDKNTDFLKTIDVNKLELAKYNTEAFKNIKYYKYNKFLKSILSDIKYNDLVLECVITGKYDTPKIDDYSKFFIEKYKTNSIIIFNENVIKNLDEDKPNLYMKLKESVLKSGYDFFGFLYQDDCCKNKTQYIFLQIITKEIDIIRLFLQNLTDDKGEKIDLSQVLVQQPGEIETMKYFMDIIYELNTQKQNPTVSLLDRIEKKYSKVLEDIKSENINEEERSQKMVILDREYDQVKIHYRFHKIKVYLERIDYLNNKDIISMIFLETLHLFNANDISIFKNYSSIVLDVFILFYYRFVLKYIERIREFKICSAYFEETHYNTQDLITFFCSDVNFNKAKTQFRIANYLVYCLMNLNITFLENYKKVLIKIYILKNNIVSTIHDKYINVLFLNGSLYDNFIYYKPETLQSFDYNYREDNIFSLIWGCKKRICTLMHNFKFYFTVKNDIYWKNTTKNKFKLGHNYKMDYINGDLFIDVLYKMKTEIYQIHLKCLNLQDFMFERDFENTLDEYITIDLVSNNNPR